MFSEHNGHELAQLEDVTSIVRKNISDLQKLIINTKKINEDNQGYITHVRDDVNRLREQQIKNIDQGFSEVIKKLEEKREQLKSDFNLRYDTEAAKFTFKLDILDQN